MVAGRTRRRRRCHLPGLREETLLACQPHVTYIASAIVCAVLFEIMVPGKSIFAELLLVQPAAIVVGAAIAGLEVGSIYMYRAGWPMNVGFIVYTASIVVVLAIVGSVFYGDSMSWMRLAGILLTLTGMFCIVK